MSAGAISDDQSAKAAITDENVGTQSKYEPWDRALACRKDCSREIIGRRGLIEIIGWPANAKSGLSHHLRYERIRLSIYRYDIVIKQYFAFTNR